MTNPDTLPAFLHAALTALRESLAPPPTRLIVAYSGGLDSTALLHALAHLPAARDLGLAAVHVDHGLHPQSSAWAEHCTRVCAGLALPLHTERATVTDIDALGLEAAARRARHAAFARHLDAGTLLALAHHRDDQAETVLLRLLHASGHEGLRGMRALRAAGDGWLWRPLLGTARDALRVYAGAHGLAWIEDPSNADTRHARNHLRHAVLPALAARWPDAARRIAASAARVDGEAQLLELAATTALAAAQGVDPATLSLSALRAHSPALRRLVIGRWLDVSSLPRPPPGVWSKLEGELIDAREDALPLLAWRGAELRRYRETLYAMAPIAVADEDFSLSWDGTGSLRLPAGFGTLRLEPARALAPMRVHRRRGGERLQQAGAHRALRTLLQDLGVPPWLRERLPLISGADGEVLAAGDLALAPAFARVLREADTCLRWEAD